MRNLKQRMSSSKSSNQKRNNDNSKKNKLRTASDVISRLRWSSLSSEEENQSSADEDQRSSIMIGYDDRINGPMEKSIVDYKTIEEGGDIPQHRIQYFRRTIQYNEENNNTTIDTTTTTTSLQVLRESIVWDRLGRIDKIFNSGNGSNCSMISDETINMAFNAIVNMKRLEEEQELKRQAKMAHRQARARRLQQQQQQLRIKRQQQQHFQQVQYAPSASAPTAANTTTISNENHHDRYEWKNVPWYEFSNDENVWKKGELSPPTSQQPQQPSQMERLKVVTWNVLFDLIETKEQDENGKDEGSCTSTSNKYEEREETSVTSGGSSSIHRWQQVIDELLRTNADIICLQEVTPTFVKMLCNNSKKVRQTYAMSAATTGTAAVTVAATAGYIGATKDDDNDNMMIDTVVPFGNLILWNRHTLDCVSLHVLQDGIYRKRCVIATLHDKVNPSNVYLCANVHLPADGVFGGYGEGNKKDVSIYGEREQQHQQAVASSSSSSSSSRAIARKRELGLIIGKLQLLQEGLYYGVGKTKKRGNKNKGNTTTTTTTTIGSSSTTREGGVPVPLIVGDFNIDDENAHELNDGCFSGTRSNRSRSHGGSSVSSSSNTTTTAEDGFFVDVWPMLLSKHDDTGATFDPTTNILAKKNSRSSNKGPRRIDRIYVGGRKSNMIKKGLAFPLLEPIDGTILGTTRGSKEEEEKDHLPLLMPPSDHYGVQVTLDIPAVTTTAAADKVFASDSPQSSSQPSSLLRHTTTINNAWSASAVPCSNTLLALVLGEEEGYENSDKMYDPQSTLPVPHITLLNGFVELNCKESRFLAKQAVQDAIQQVLVLQSLDGIGNTQGDNDNGLVVPFHKDNSLSIFEHSSSSLSCSVVQIPDVSCDRGRWLRQLYATLRSSFRLCDTQESRFQLGWTPHGKLKRRKVITLANFHQT